MSRRPLSAAAMSGVRPSEEVAFTLAPWASRERTEPACPADRGDKRRETVRIAGVEAAMLRRILDAVSGALR